MIPPAPRRCGDQPANLQEELEEALVYIFEINDHESFGRCGANSADPARVLCSRCIARNALVRAGWTLNQHEQTVERARGLLDAAPSRAPQDA